MCGSLEAIEVIDVVGIHTNPTPTTIEVHISNKTYQAVTNSGHEARICQISY